MMFRWQTTLIPLFACSIVTPALAQVKTEASASYEKSPGFDNKLVPTYVARDVRHEFLGYPGGDAKFIRFIHERSEKQSIEGGMSGPVLAELFEVSTPGSVAVSRWKASGFGNSIHVDVRTGFWTIQRNGCCGSTDTYDFRSVVTGKKLFSYTKPRSLNPYIIESGTDPSTLRVAGFINSHWPVADIPSAPPGVDEKKWMFIGELYFATGEKLIDRVAFLREPWNDPADDPDEFSVVETGNDFRTIKRKIRLKFFEEVIEIPIAGDRLEISNATIPKAWQLRRL